MARKRAPLPTLQVSPPGPAPAQGVAGLADEGRDADLEQERGGIERLAFTCVSLAGLRSGGIAVHSASRTRVKRADGRERASELGTLDVPIVLHVPHGGEPPVRDGVEDR